MDTKKDLKKAEIIKAAQKRFIKHGLAKTSVEEIARDMRIGKSTIYTYFGSKEEIYYSCIESELRQYLELAASIINDPQTAAHEKSSRFFALKADLPQSCRLLIKCIILFLAGESNSAEESLIRQYIESETGLIKQIIDGLPAGPDQSIHPSLAAINSISLPLTIVLQNVMSEKQFALTTGQESIEHLIRFWDKYLTSPADAQA